LDQTRILASAALKPGMLRMRTLPAGFVAPCLPTKADTPPSGGLWLHEIKHDGFRVIARKDGPRVRLYSRLGNDLTDRFPLIVEALGRLRSRSCIIDGEAVCCDNDGRANFDRIRYRRHDASVFLYAFDLIELNGDDLRRDPLEVRKATLASVLAKAGPGVRLNEHLEHDDGEVVFRHACKLGLEGIVSKRLGSRCRSGRSSGLGTRDRSGCRCFCHQPDEIVGCRLASVQFYLKMTPMPLFGVPYWAVFHLALLGFSSNLLLETKCCARVK
jgi:bifunctional non-homologous end joining protein LigD